MQPPKHWWKTWVPWVVVAGASVGSFFIGRYVSGAAPLQTLPLRAPGYEFISPLLTCNNLRSFSESQQLNGKISAAINAHESAGDVSKASVFFTDLATGEWSEVNPDLKYYPSSLGKVPVMIAYFEAAEEDPAILDKKITYPLGSASLNLTQDIPPARAIVPGQTYTVSDLITYMIEDSDNNATKLLTDNIDEGALRNIYADLQIPINDDPTIATLDYISPRQISLLFRVLYNATMLSREDSEKALKLLSHSSFTQGIAAGVPSSTVIAHKLGLVGIDNGGVATEHELHDCGIIYAPQHSYTLCIMTRGSSPLSAMEGTIADISRTVYAEVENGYQ